MRFSSLRTQCNMMHLQYFLPGNRCARQFRLCNKDVSAFISSVTYFVSGEFVVARPKKMIKREVNPIKGCCTVGFKTTKLYIRLPNSRYSISIYGSLKRIQFLSLHTLHRVVLVLPPPHIPSHRLG
jgi:hypothetical protein